MVEQWRRLGAFLKRPTLEVRGETGSPFVLLARIFALDMMIMFALISIAGAVIALGIDLPKTALADMEFTPWLLVLVICVAPLLEELIFRGWLPGRPSQLLVLGGLVMAGGLMAYSSAGNASSASVQVIALAVVLAALVAAVVVIRRPTPQFYATLFPVFYWLSVVAFALVHLANFAEGGAVLLALVLPQFVLGTLLGYVRVRIGLWASILLHAAHNATAITIAALGSAAA